jgi:hypothetical protein
MAGADPTVCVPLDELALDEALLAELELLDVLDVDALLLLAAVLDALLLALVLDALLVPPPAPPCSATRGELEQDKEPNAAQRRIAPGRSKLSIGIPGATRERRRSEGYRRKLET